MKLTLFVMFLAFLSIVVLPYSDITVFQKIILYLLDGVTLFFCGMNIEKYYEDKRLMKILERRKNMLRSF